jgi:hypothetical protein
MKFADTISSFFVTLTQQLINVLTSAENVKKYDVIIQNILDNLESSIIFSGDKESATLVQR